MCIPLKLPTVAMQTFHSVSIREHPLFCQYLEVYYKYQQREQKLCVPVSANMNIAVQMTATLQAQQLLLILRASAGHVHRRLSVSPVQVNSYVSLGIGLRDESAETSINGFGLSLSLPVLF